MVGGALVVGSMVVVDELTGAFVVVAPVVEVGRGLLLVDVAAVELGPSVAALPTSLPPHAAASSRATGISNHLSHAALGFRSSRLLTTLALHQCVG